MPPLPQQYMLCIFHIPPLTNSCREVCDCYLQPWPVDHLEVKWLQSQIPTRDLCVGILLAVGPLEQGIVRTESESPSQQVVMESEDRLLDGQPFLLDRAVFSLSYIESLQLIYSRGRSAPSTTLDKMAPSPLSDASTCKTKGRAELGECNTGPPYSAAFTWVKAC